MKTLKKLTVSIVVSYSYPYIGSGIGNVAQKQAELLAKDGHTVHLHSSNFPQTESFFERNNVSFIKFPALYFLEKFSVPVPLTVLSPMSIKKIAESDIVHVHDGMYLSSFFAAMIAKLLGKKLVVTVHISHIKYTNPVINALEYIAEFLIAKPIFELADRLVLINGSLKKDLAAYENKMVILSNGVDTELFQAVSPAEKKELKVKNRINPNKKIVLFVGRLVPKKGFNLVLEARSKEYDILFVGSGEVPPQKKNLPGVFWIGPVTQDKLAEYYQMADVLVLPSHGEGYPLSIKEAISAGVPVITTFTHDSLNDLKDKVIFEVEPNTDHIRDRITHVLKKAPKTMEMSERKNFLTKFNWEQNIADLKSIYSDIL